MTVQEKQQRRSLFAARVRAKKNGSSAFDNNQIMEFECLLLCQKKTLTEELKGLSGEIEKELSVALGSSQYGSNHIADKNPEISDVKETMAMNRLKRIRKIDEALRRIKDGTYGICLDCGEAIGVKRLQATPIADLCVDCKEKKERMEKFRRGASRNQRGSYPQTAAAF